MSKQPMYTALGWVVFQLGKRYAKKRARRALPSRKFLIFGTLGAATAAAAIAATSASSHDQ